MDRKYTRIRRIHTTDAAKLVNEEFVLLSELLKECFSIEALEATMTWKSLLSGDAHWNGRRNYNDNKMIHMVNSYPNALKRAKLQHLFGLLDDDLHVDFYNFKISFTTIVPRANAQFNGTRLSEITEVRMTKFWRYLDEIGYQWHSHPELSKNDNFDELITALKWGNNWNDCFFSIDLENYEGHEDIITEIGIAIMDPTLSEGEPSEAMVRLINMHIIIQENQHLRNGKYVEDNRDYFTGGTSMVMNRTQALKFIQTVIDFYFIERKSLLGMGCLLVGQSVHGDISKLKQFGVKFPDQIRVADTLAIASLSLGRGNCSLKNLLYGIDGSSFSEVDYLHNAGNDATGALHVFMKMVRIENREQLGLDHADSRVLYNFKSLESRELRRLTSRGRLCRNYTHASTTGMRPSLLCLSHTMIRTKRMDNLAMLRIKRRSLYMIRCRIHKTQNEKKKSGERKEKKSRSGYHIDRYLIPVFKTSIVRWLLCNFFRGSAEKINYQNMARKYTRIRRILTTDAAKLAKEEFTLLSELLKECFSIEVLKATLTWKSLLSGSAHWNGRRNYNDSKMIHMVNSYPNALKRAKLQHLFGLLGDDLYVSFCNFNFKISFTTLVPRANARHDSKRLSEITDVRMKKVRRYLDEIRNQSLSHPELSKNDNFDALQKALTWGNNWKDCFFSMDLENYEGRGDLITEIGIAIMDPTLSEGEPSEATVRLISMHIIIQENQHLRNGKYVEDNRDYFTGGASMVMSRTQAIKFIQTVIDFYFIERKSQLDMDCFLVGQNVRGDITTLKEFGIDFPDPMRVADTLVISAMSLGRGSCSLKNLLYGIDCSSDPEIDYLHNAGNDATATLNLFMKMVRVESREELGLDHAHSRALYNFRVERARKTHVKREILPQPKPRHYNWEEAIVDVFRSAYN